MTSIEFYERDTVIKRIKDNLNQINQRYFEGNHGILSVTDNGDYVAVENRGIYLADYDTQKLFDALENFSKEDYESGNYYDLWDYLDNCEYTLPEDQKTENELKTDDELSFSEKRQVELVDWLLSEPASVHENSSLDDWTLNLIPQSPNFRLQSESSTLSELVEELERKNEILEKKNQELEQSKEYSQAWLDNLQQRVHDLECAVYLLQQENKQLKDQSEAKTELKPEPKLEKKTTTKKQPKFKLPETFANYQQECDDLINALSCFYNIKKGKWGKDILQFILTPTDTEKTKLPYPDKWKAGLYLQPGQWTIDKVNMSDPEDWQDWFMDINDFADSNGIEIS